MKNRSITLYLTFIGLLLAVTIGWYAFSFLTQPETDSAFDGPVIASYDFSGLPNGGRLFYERYEWGMAGERWRELAGAACQELGVGPVL